MLRGRLKLEEHGIAMKLKLALDVIHFILRGRTSLKRHDTYTCALESHHAQRAGRGTCSTAQLLTC